MPTPQDIETLLGDLIHPETGVDIVSSGIAHDIKTDGGRISLTLSFPRARDPFSGSLRRQAESAIAARWPELAGHIDIMVREAAPPARQGQPRRSNTGRIRNTVAVVSGKGGVGKSTVASNLAVRLAGNGYRVGLLDADIYGPSQPKMFGLEGYSPAAKQEDGAESIVPAESLGVKVMSIGFFISGRDALAWRGPMASSALKQMIHQTDWGELDFLLIDMPPGTGDVHLTVIQELRVDGAVVVSTPQQVAVADAVRAVEMLRMKDIAVPVLGVVENMAWFTPAELPGSRYHIFGNGGGERLAREEGLELLGRIPVIMSVAQGGDGGKPAVADDAAVAGYYEHVAGRIVEKLTKKVDNGRDMLSINCAE